MRPVPRKILVKNKIYKIAIRKHLVRDKQELDGYCIFADQQILIRKDQTDEDLRLTMIHEIIHALLQEHGLRRQFTAADLEVEESFVKELEEVIRRFFVPR